MTGDMISICARRRRSRSVYRIEDEYGTRFRFKPKTSTQPLSLGELIALIDGATGHLGGDLSTIRSVASAEAASSLPFLSVVFRRLRIGK